MERTNEEVRAIRSLPGCIAALHEYMERIARQLDIYSFTYSKEAGLSMGISGDSLAKLPGDITIRNSSTFDSTPLFVKSVHGVEFYATRTPSGVKFKLVQLETEPSEAAA